MVKTLGERLGLRPGEARTVILAFAYFFCLLTSYYILRPLRDEMGIAGGVRNLQWLFTATFFAMLAAVPLFGWLVAKLPRKRFLPLVYHVLTGMILLFWLAFTLLEEKIITARVFFIWTSVFNLFAVTIFWSFMADLFDSAQAKRLFGLIAAGGSVGALCGPLLTVTLVGPLGPVNLLLVSAVLLECAVACAVLLERQSVSQQKSQANKDVGGHWLSGLMLILRNPYLAGIAGWVALLSLLGTVLYFMQATIVSGASVDPAVRTKLFAQIDLAVSLVTILTQFLASGALLARFGTGRAAAFAPLVFAGGFLVLGFLPVFASVIAFQAAQRAANFSLSNLARETLFTVVDREAKYKAKSAIDMVVFRGADMVAGWIYFALAASLSLSHIAWLMVPVAVIWIILSLVLGRRQEYFAQARSQEDIHP